MEHLGEIEEPAVRNAVDIFQTTMELWILRLLGEDRDKALAEIDRARDSALDHIKNELGSEFSAMDQEVKTLRIALSILERTYERLRDVYEAPDDDDAAIG